MARMDSLVTQADRLAAEEKAERLAMVAQVDRLADEAKAERLAMVAQVDDLKMVISRLEDQMSVISGRPAAVKWSCSLGAHGDKCKCSHTLDPLTGHPAGVTVACDE